MNTTPSFIGFDALKQTVSMVQILDRYGLTERLRRSGDSLTGVCPIHAGHNPSQFRVSLSRNCWICFGDCNGGGSIIDFVSRKEAVGIREAALLIQDWFDVHPRNGEGAGPNGQERIKQAPQVEPAGPLANPPLRFTLRDLDGTHPYLAERGLSPETIATFGLGHCRKGSLAGWIAIPIHSHAGVLLAYAVRWPGVPPKDMPKYRLPKGFRKSLELFNVHRASRVDPAQALIVVEGFFGCMKVWQAGFRRVVALMGSMLSRAQEELIVQTAGPDGRVTLMFDEDVAGRKGRAEAKERLSRHLTVDVIRFEAEGTQPDSLPSERLQALLR